MKHKIEKQNQLGMNPSTAQHRLVKDILWSFIVKLGLDTCCKCGSKMCRNTFSIEHIVPWLHSRNPLDLFFDLDNISFSHLKCNISDARNPRKNQDREDQRQKNLARARKWKSKNRVYDPIERKERYKRLGS